MEENWQPHSEPNNIDSDELNVKHDDDLKIMFAKIAIRFTSTNSMVPNIKNLIFVDVDEAKTFLTAKRAEEHAAGRYLLQYLLQRWDPHLDLSQIEVKRERGTRRPYLSWIEGTYQGKKLPEFSISHSNGLAMIGLCESDYVIGLDVEPINEERLENLMEFVSEGDELEKLRSYWLKNPIVGKQILNQIWTIKESCMKSLGIGMGINPINLKIPHEIIENFPIEKSNFQLKYLEDNLSVSNSTLTWNDRYSTSVSIRKKRTSEQVTRSQAEQDMYDSLQSSANIGCSSN